MRDRLAAVPVEHRRHASGGSGGGPSGATLRPGAGSRDGGAGRPVLHARPPPALAGPAHAQAAAGVGGAPGVVGSGGGVGSGAQLQGRRHAARHADQPPREPRCRRLDFAPRRRAARARDLTELVEERGGARALRGHGGPAPLQQRAHPPRRRRVHGARAARRRRLGLVIGELGPQPAQHGRRELGARQPAGNLPGIKRPPPHQPPNPPSQLGSQVPAAHPGREHALVRLDALKQLVAQHAEGVDVGRRAWRLGRALARRARRLGREQLGRHRGQRADAGQRRRARRRQQRGAVKVHEAHGGVGVRPGDGRLLDTARDRRADCGVAQHVGQLDVAVHDAARVGLLERARQHAKGLQHARPRERVGRRDGQVVSALLHDEAEPRLAFGFEQARGQVGSASAALHHSLGEAVALHHSRVAAECQELGFFAQPGGSLARRPLALCPLERDLLDGDPPQLAARSVSPLAHSDAHMRSVQQARRAQVELVVRDARNTRAKGAEEQRALRGRDRAAKDRAGGGEPPYREHRKRQARFSRPAPTPATNTHARPLTPRADS